MLCMISLGYARPTRGIRYEPRLSWPEFCPISLAAEADDRSVARNASVRFSHHSPVVSVWPEWIGKELSSPEKKERTLGPNMRFRDAGCERAEKPYWGSRCCSFRGVNLGTRSEVAQRDPCMDGHLGGNPCTFERSCSVARGW